MVAEDMEILLLQARLDQTEQTLQKLIGLCRGGLERNSLIFLISGQMGALTASLANAGLVVNPDSDDPEDLGEGEECVLDNDDDNDHQDEESDSDDETEDSEEDVSDSE